MVEVAQWSIYWAILDPTIGSEQAGRRPVLVISTDAVNVLNTVTVLPLTSYKSPQRKIRRNEVFLSHAETGLDRDSIVLAHQIRTLDKARLVSIAGKITNAPIKESIVVAVKVQLGL